MTEKPLRTLLGKAREGAGQPVSLKLEAGLESAVSQAMDALRTATGDWSKVLPQAPRKGSLMERLMKDRGAAGHMKVRGGGGDWGKGVSRGGSCVLRGGESVALSPPARRGGQLWLRQWGPSPDHAAAAD